MEFCRSLVASEHTLTGVFFYQDGVLNAAQNQLVASDEFNALSQWQTLHQQHQIPLHLCITAAEKRGLSDENALSLANSDFVISGLGQFAEMSIDADRVIQL